MENKLDLRIQKTYLALHNAFDSLMEEKRFEEVTINELCDRAMIRRTTFYKHFADKYEYYAFYIREVIANFQERLDPEVAEGGVDAYLLHMSRELVRFMKQHNRLVQNIKMSSMFPILLSILLEQISFDMVQLFLHKSNGNPDKEKIEGIAAFYAGGVVNTLFQFLKKGEPMDENQFIDIISEFLIS